MYRQDIQNMEETELLELNNRLGLDTETNADELCEYLAVSECVEEDILDTFTNGAYTQGAEQMLEAFITPNELISWLLDQREEREYYFENIDLLTAVSIAESYNQARLN